MSLLVVSQQWICIQLLFVHEMSAVGYILIINTCGLATMSMEVLYFISTDEAMSVNVLNYVYIS